MNQRHFSIFLVLAMFAFVISSGCGGSQTEETAPLSEEEAYDDSYTVSAGPGVVEGLKATVPQGEVDTVIAKNVEPLYDCYESALEDLEDIEGTVEFAFEIGDGNRVVKIFVRKSDLGSMEAEECMANRVSKLQFERQGGGIAEVTKELLFEAPHDPPDPVVWSDNIVQKVVTEKKSDVDECLKGATGIHITLWVGKGGMVWSSGYATDDFSQKDAGACLANAARKWKFPDPGGNDVAKVQVSF